MHALNKRTGPPHPGKRRNSSCISEMKEFATFPKGTQRYIRRSLDVALGRCDPIARWSRSPGEAKRIWDQQCLYEQLDALAAIIPVNDEATAAGRLIGALGVLTAFDLAEGHLGSFDAYRFLYERLVGPAVRPWLVSAFCAAAALPQLHPELRGRLLNSLSPFAATAPGWSCLEPVFYPEWIDMIDAVSA